MPLALELIDSGHSVTIVEGRDEGRREGARSEEGRKQERKEGHLDLM